ncbi:MAG TPA: 2-C-methyl-D-erythritol 4-phosphate cytidylyltransferase [Candidatus Marinimicrobia bacterium]|jgi:2-C-methyl-D-erythritol 4-phosphate cytidylyltransferase|nr:2-C-methyl-D-erythritol 4-phosphate cytidylyltransferase [Candidatus Neomarinimicrobiota bacterium]MDP7330207.1 2-C-methyl-D-erythritol 4-phosphate cytidylyltransferase [Candidatus Neomarinimicrobiota bacterium]HBN45551.1 2-C-methyl-D-erythritol 4-phosphate cytidylyltransferase [Candidatus Neomarinimicrobiota bacterium]HJL74432.1 2-C-methyl-D-erythritol 4-phosphate cytidylyltransferase [Candidatus Neomarinimicrobiota bacterium]HJM69292.1 2-C-methyl-D-erythritol 4-phosphate cytidylyltransfera|tara:strand:+ start:30002 stop:30670 length:669 start_codon:yes stop_codon:yes gene_type:complete
MHETLKAGAVIAAAGSGKRFGEKKQFKLLGRRPLLFHTLTLFLECDNISEIVVVVPEDDLDNTQRELASFTSTKHAIAVAGGQRRKDSVYNGCIALSEDISIITVHDAARPFVTPELINATIQGCADSDGCIVALPSKDTVKQVLGKNIQQTLDRNAIWLAQTPQTFHRDILIKALQQKIDATDEASMVEALSGNVTVVEGTSSNFKITTVEDWNMAEKVLS